MPNRFEKIDQIDDIVELTRSRVIKFTLNDFVNALHRMLELEEKTGQTQNHYAIQDLVQQIQIKFKQQHSEDPLLGKLLFSLQKLNNHRYNILIDQIVDFLAQDIYDNRFDEILFALKGFQHLDQKLQQDWAKELRTEVEQKIYVHFQEYLTKSKYSLQEIKEVLVILDANNFNQQYDLLEEVEFQVMKLDSLGQINRADDLVLFSYIMTKAGYNCEKLFQMTTKYIIDEIQTFSFNGMSIRKFLFSFNYFLKNNELFSIDKLIINKIKENIFDIDHSLNGIIQICKCFDQLDIKDHQEFQTKLQEIVLKQEFQLCGLHDIQDYIVLQKDSEINIQVLLKLDELTSSLLSNKTSKQEILELIKFLEQKSIVFPKLLVFLPKYVEHHLAALDFDDVCYYYVQLKINQEKYEQQIHLNQNFHSQLEKIKQFIKHFSTREGFRMSLNSNYYKLLNIVDLAEFFEGGYIEEFP